MNNVYAELGTGSSEGRMAIASQFGDKELIKIVPGARWNKEQRQWTVPLTYAAGVTLRGVFGDRLLLGPNLIHYMRTVRTDRIDPANELRLRTSYADTDKTSYLCSNVAYLTSERLFPFQQTAVAFMHTAESGLLGDDMGCGKTVELLSLLRYNHLSGVPTFPALVICPNSVKHHWAQRVPEWLDVIGGVTPTVLDGTLANRRKLLTQASEIPNAIVIVNFESVRSLSRLAPYGSVRLTKCTECDPHNGTPGLKVSACEVHPKELNVIPFRTVIIDEAHRLKDPKAKQTRATWAVAHGDSVTTCWAATGTPVANHLGDLWSIMHTVAPAEYPVRSSFVDRYALKEWNPFGGLDITGVNPQTSDEFQRFFQPRFRRMQKSVVLPQLPPKVHTVRTVEMSAAQRRMYRDFVDSFMAETDAGDLIVTPSQLGAQTRLSQLACATLDIIDRPSDDPSTWTVGLKEPSSKLDEMMAVLEEIDLKAEQVVLAADHSKLIDLACARLKKVGIHHVKITGDVSPFDRQKALDAFHAGHVRVLLFTTKAGGTGLNMSCASHLVFLQHPWSMVDYKQAEDRVHRIGSEQHNAVTITHIITSDTIEERKMAKLQEKLDRLEEITRDRASRTTSMVLSGMSLDEARAAIEQEQEQLLTDWLG